MITKDEQHCRLVSVKAGANKKKENRRNVQDRL